MKGIIEILDADDNPCLISVTEIAHIGKEYKGTTDMLEITLKVNDSEGKQRIIGTSESLTDVKIKINSALNE